MLTPRRFEDGRGFFCENYHKRRLTEVGIDADFVQDNLSLSKPAGTLRGLHFQTEPMDASKLRDCSSLPGFTSLKSDPRPGAFSINSAYTVLG